MSRVCILLLCFVFVYANGNIIRNDIGEPAVTTKEISVPKDIDDLQSVEPVVQPEIETMATKCAEIGEFCTNHTDCCTNACLGYMKKCVSGSG